MFDWYQYLPSYIDPIIVSFGSFSIRWYSVMYLVGFSVAYLLLMWRIKKGETVYDKKTITSLLIFAFIGLLVGARLGHVLFYNLNYYLQNPIEIISPFQNSCSMLHAPCFKYTGLYGMSYFGGLIGVVLAGLIFSLRRKIHPIKSASPSEIPKGSKANFTGQGGPASREFNRVNFWSLADFIVPVVSAGFFFGRIGNFLNGELYGKVTEMPWGMYFPADELGLLRHPTQLYEAFLEGIVLFLILWLLRNKSKFPGYLLAVYLLGYGLFRIIAELFRELTVLGGTFTPWLSLSMILAFTLIILAVFIYYFQKRRIVV